MYTLWVDCFFEAEKTFNNLSNLKSFPLIYFPKNMNTNHSGTEDVSAAAGDFFLFPKKPFSDDLSLIIRLFVNTWYP